LSVNCTFLLFLVPRLTQIKGLKTSLVVVSVVDKTGKNRLYHRGKQDKRQLVIYDYAEKQEILRMAHSDVTGSGMGRPSTTAGGVPHNGKTR